MSLGGDVELVALGVGERGVAEAVLVDLPDERGAEAEWAVGLGEVGVEKSACAQLRPLGRSPNCWNT